MSNNKYDRQLRLWGENGQAAIRSAHILLVGGCAVGTETLKNLVLPGIGEFTVMDHVDITSRDLNCNFFVDPSSLGKKRAQITADFLAEMNPDVTGHCDTRNVEEVLQNDPNFFERFTLIILANATNKVIREMSDMCVTMKKPLVVVTSYGFLGWMRLQYKDHDIMESRPLYELQDLRLLNPFPELKAYLDNFELTPANVDDIPYTILLYRVAQAWRAEHNNEMPESFEDKEAFSSSIAKYIAFIKQNQTEAESEMADNYNEAMQNAHEAYAKYSIPGFVSDILEDNESEVIDKNSSEFSVLVRALSKFVQSEDSHGYLPISGQLADMSCSTKEYLALSKIYQQKFVSDKLRMTDFVREIEKETGRDHAIAEATIELFCKNASRLRKLSTRTMAEERAEINDVAMLQYDKFESDALQTPWLWYIGIQASLRFQEQHGHFPGQNLTADEESLRSQIDELYALMQSSLPFEESSLTRDHAAEMARCGGIEMSSVSSLLGGIASQEAIKIVSKQFVPFNNSYVYNGVAGVGSVYEL